jgi:glutamate 5-kinase
MGCQVVIASGKEPGNLGRILEGEAVGTWFRAQGSRLSSRQSWLVHATKPKGLLQVDPGAQAALIRGKRSLLPSGIVEVEGTFGLGDPVNVAGPDRQPFARALAGYSADELRRIKGCKSADIEGILGYRSVDEAVHRDDLALL